MLKHFIAREFVLLGVPSLLAVIAWTGVFGGVQWVLAVIIGACGGMYGASRAFIRWLQIKDSEKTYGLKYPDELGPPPAIAMSSTIGGVAGFSALVGLITWGIKSLVS